MSLRHAVLGVLSARPMTGYDLSRLLDASTGWLWSARHSQVYPLLARLVDDGLVSSTEDTRGEHLRRWTYQLTPAGERELVEWVGTEHPGGPTKDPFWLQAVLLDLVEPAVAARVLRAYADDQRARAEQATAHAAELAAGRTPLVSERLRNRPAAEHERITRLKAGVFTAQAAIATTRAEQAEELARLVEA